MDYFLRITKIRISGYYDKITGKSFVSCFLDKIGAVHPGHLDIEEHETGIIKVYHFERFSSGRCFIANGKSEGFPVDYVSQSLADDLFIVGDKNADHIIFHICSFTTKVYPYGCFQKYCQICHYLDLPVQHDQDGCFQKRFRQMSVAAAE